MDIFLNRIPSIYFLILVNILFLVDIFYFNSSIFSKNTFSFIGLNYSIQGYVNKS